MNSKHKYTGVAVAVVTAETVLTFIVVVEIKSSQSNNNETRI
jgi:hypothetical protein